MTTTIRPSRPTLPADLALMSDLEILDCLDSLEEIGRSAKGGLPDGMRGEFERLDNELADRDGGMM